MRTSHLALPASQCEQFRKAFVSQTRASQRLCRAATGASFLPSRYAAIKSIDVEFAHFVNKGQITTAAAEVCLLAEDGSVLLNSYICPGNLYESFRSIKVAPVCSMACPSAELHAASSGFDWIGGVTVENYTDAPTLKVIQQQLTTLLEGSLLIGYGLSKDLSSLRLHHPHALQKDLIRYRKFQSSTGQARKLQEISQRFLSHDIQAGKHTAREDAFAALQLYLQHVRNDPALMTYQELVDYELRNLPFA
ncbi:MAG: RNA exonuclease 4 [Trebouxia sp. A1-2]|nr:MAG: RNA exonuclease 4 [Trebouxia sp. A1-2]